MNPLFGRMMPNMLGGVGGNSMQNMMNTINQIKQMKQNPNGLADLLLNNGKISKEQYEQIKGYNPQQIGQYLMQSGTMPQQQVQQAYQTIVPQVQQQLKNN